MNPPATPYPLTPAPIMAVDDFVARIRAYDSAADVDFLKRAYAFADKAHGDQKRASGERYFSHPLAVACLLADMRMDSTTIVTALLHDTVEDTGVTLNDIEKQFGAQVAKLVDGVTKLSRIEFQNDQAKQAENFRKLVLAMSEDIRVLLIKLADRLHNMRTLKYVKEDHKRKRIARETLDIYAPLAERIGIEKMQDELEDLAFAELNGDARESIVARLNFLRSEGGDIAKQILDEIDGVLQKDGVRAELNGREKTPYSIWRKMQKKNVTYEQLSDIMAFRVIVDGVEQCYQALGILHSHYHVIPGRFKDYISTPKQNQYQSLHTGVIGPKKQRIEIQIRTHAMHSVAELGVAAHWEYKGDAVGRTDGLQYRWVRELVDIVENAQKPEEFLEQTKLELFHDQVFCFSPKGDLIALPRGATPVDFAYAVHSNIGNCCVGAKVNGRIVPLKTTLHNGDQVEIVTQKGGNPSPAWDRFVVSAKARSSIRKFVRQQQHTEYERLGKSMIERLCEQEGVVFAEKTFEAIAKNFQSASLAELYANVGASMQSVRDVFNAAYPAHKKNAQTPVDVEAIKNKAQTSRNAPLTLKGLIPGMAVHYARCCHPLPGDAIVGIVTTGKGVTVHTRDCEMLEALEQEPERWIDVSWEDGHGKELDLIGRLSIVLNNVPSSMATMTTIIGKHGGNITNLKITHRTPEFFDMYVDVQVRDKSHLTDMIAALRASTAVNSVDRMKGR